MAEINYKSLSKLKAPRLRGFFVGVYIILIVYAENADSR